MAALDVNYFFRENQRGHRLNMERRCAPHTLGDALLAGVPRMLSTIVKPGLGQSAFHSPGPEPRRAGLSLLVGTELVRSFPCSTVLQGDLNVWQHKGLVW